MYSTVKHNTLHIFAKAENVIKMRSYSRPMVGSMSFSKLPPHLRVCTPNPIQRPLTRPAHFLGASAAYDIDLC